MPNFARDTSPRALDWENLEIPETDRLQSNTTTNAAKSSPAKTMAKPRVVYDNDGTHKLPALTVVTLFIVLAAAFVIASGIAQVSVLKREEALLTEELRQENLLINGMTEEINRTQDVAKMRETAKELGMGEPQSYQITHITVPENDYAEISD
ncbi:MAG: hypothetical protein LBL96_00525 [Clostridiales bacterium]|jgi:hypothetical protein|nr:hypothetical protein [Clostridiales bacterium]